MPDRDSESKELAAILDAAVRKTFKDDAVLLYDASGKPLLRDSEIWQSAKEPALSKLLNLLNELTCFLEKLSPPNSPERLGEILGQMRQSSKCTFDIVDGKLTFPVPIKAGGVQVKAHIPLYALLASAIGAGFWASLRSL